MAKIQVEDKFGKLHEIEESECVYRKSVYGLAFKDGKIVLIKDPRSGRWELPGGGIEPGETNSECVMREFREESGLEIKPFPMKLLHNAKGYYFAVGDNQAWKTDRSYYLVTLSGNGRLLENGNGDDTVAARLITLEELDKLRVAAKDREVIEIAHQKKYN